jgi:hypothetical protein
MTYSMGAASANGASTKLPYLDLAYDHANSEATAKELVYTIQPKWRECPDEIKIVQFKEGITNTVIHRMRRAHVLVANRGPAI